MFSSWRPIQEQHHQDMVSYLKVMIMNMQEFINSFIPVVKTSESVKDRCFMSLPLFHPHPCVFTSMIIVTLLFIPVPDEHNSIHYFCMMMMMMNMMSTPCFAWGSVVSREAAAVSSFFSLFFSPLISPHLLHHLLAPDSLPFSSPCSLGSCIPFLPVLKTAWFWSDSPPLFLSYLFFFFFSPSLLHKKEWTRVDRYIFSLIQVPLLVSILFIGLCLYASCTVSSSSSSFPDVTLMNGRRSWSHSLSLLLNS